MMASKLDSQQPRMVGIFWLVDGRQVIDASLLSEVEAGGGRLDHAQSDDDFWAEQQRLGAAAREMGYEQSPRGRVVYNTKTQRVRVLCG